MSEYRGANATYLCNRGSPRLVDVMWDDYDFRNPDSGIAGFEKAVHMNLIAAEFGHDLEPRTPVGLSRKMFDDICWWVFGDIVAPRLLDLMRLLRDASWQLGEADDPTSYRYSGWPLNPLIQVALSARYQPGTSPSVKITDHHVEGLLSSPELLGVCQDLLAPIKKVMWRVDPSGAVAIASAGRKGYQTVTWLLRRGLRLDIAPITDATGAGKVNTKILSLLDPATDGVVITPGDVQAAWDQFKFRCFLGQALLHADSRVVWAEGALESTREKWKWDVCSPWCAEALEHGNNEESPVVGEWQVPLWPSYHPIALEFLQQETEH